MDERRHARGDSRGTAEAPGIGIPGGLCDRVSDPATRTSLAAVALQQVHRVDRDRVAVDALRVEVHDRSSARAADLPQSTAGCALCPPLLSGLEHYIPGCRQKVGPTCCVASRPGVFPGTMRIGHLRHGVSRFPRTCRRPDDEAATALRQRHAPLLVPADRPGRGTASTRSGAVDGCEAPPARPSSRRSEEGGMLQFPPCCGPGRVRALAPIAQW